MTTDRLGFLQFLGLSIASWNEFGLMRCFVLALPLTFSSLCFSVVRLALVLQATNTLAYWSGGDTRLFIRSIVETGSSLLLEGDICVVLCEWGLENHQTWKKKERISGTYVHSLFLGLVSHATESQRTCLRYKDG